MNDLREQLMVAANRGLADEVESLLDFGVDPDTVDDAGFSAMRYAVMSGHADVVSLLESRGAAPWIPEENAP